MIRKASTRINPYHAQYILRRRDDYLELFDRDALSSRFFYDAFPGMRLRHPVTDDTSDDRLAHSPGDRMYMLGGMSDTASNRITFERDSQYSGHDLPVKMRGPGGQSVRLPEGAVCGQAPDK
ncbi:TPA: hypothetical protein IRR18_005036 [Escherichia coli]|nr:hypothetical protein [Escherichia coli]HAP0235290.1 hypothetical protein [Escherichia coli]HAP0245740.1 hypothetical protein [Escherichia coli]HAP0333412.1 hypothetical protein [Escherichia coli]HAP0338702.1 hypothetical protein [Escherichia coli]